MGLNRLCMHPLTGFVLPESSGVRGQYAKTPGSSDQGVAGGISNAALLFCDGYGGAFEGRGAAARVQV
jgi:hypothetical protein